MDRILLSDLLIEKLGRAKIKDMVDNGEEEEVHLTSGLRLKVFGKRREGHLEVQIWEDDRLVETKIMTMYADFGILDHQERRYNPHMYK